MFVKKYKKKLKVYFFILFFLCFIIISFSLNRVNVYAETLDNDRDEILNNNENEFHVLSSDKKNENIVDIDTVGISEFTDVKYISNANYFLVNPHHAVNDGTDNGAGTCTTVAMQILMGYHNYYSDRRLIPKFGDEVNRFLNDSYGNLTEHPDLDTSITSGQGRTSIGTEDGFYNELLDLSLISGVYGIGQAVGVVKDAAVLFVYKYASDISDNISITSGFFSKSTARADIDSNKPIILGFNPIFTGADSFHVVPAYGYATLDGVEGKLQHRIS